MTLLRLFIITVLIAAGPLAAADGDSPDSPAIVEPPADLELSAFYEKCVVVEGFPIVSSRRVHNAALREAAWIIRRMLGDRTDILKALAESETRFAIMACDELTTDIPEHSDLTPARFWDRRARGLGATPARPCVSCGEENLLCYPGDPYAAENILVHEFAHAIHGMGLNNIDDQFDQRLKAAYEQAMDEGLWEGKYAANNRMEYWAEGVQSYFDTNRPPDHDHNHVDTRDELAEYDPRLFALIDEVFEQNPWRYQRPADRSEDDRRHLAGYDPD
ncbi:MAG: hypothetical protein DWQ34_18645 [Planctomycetota bacterium]|nr:MAG: hypothetical protein DWQ29_22555 [Planctomycetota bacterium]REJ89762.1 MAG: hypothetical protein DWQ34_18645 [Planctomycetota bacterium]REK26414.1 MAG: hypothetical protein DWQ41_09950 [Planctomycetota bacterium]REK32047.1 MAG: hypothetical protein DWQ45_17940 [Planctomycetota bacterium]